MKKLLIISILLVFALRIFGQAVAPEVALSKEYYLEKSKHRKAAAWTFLGIGTAAIGGGLLIATAHSDDPIDEFGNALSGTFLITAGTLLDFISVPLFIGASKSRKHAAEVTTSIKMEDISPAVGSAFHQSTAPAVSVKYRF